MGRLLENLPGSGPPNLWWSSRTSDVEFSLSSCYIMVYSSVFSPSLKNGIRMSLDFKGFRFNCERLLGLYRWCSCLSLGLIFGRDIPTPQ